MRGATFASLLGLALSACEPSQGSLPAADRVLWARAIGGSARDVAQSLGVGPLEQGVLALRTSGALVVGERRFPEARLPRTVLVGFDRSGGLTPLGSLSPGDQAGLVDLFELRVATDELQNIVLAGTLAGDDFVLEDGVVLPRQASNGFEPFVALLGPSGASIWAIRGRAGRVQRVSVGPEGIWIAGQASGPIALGDFTADTRQGDAYLARLGAQGRVELFIRLRGDGVQLQDLDLGRGSVWLGGRAEGEFRLQTSDSTYAPGAFVARLDARTGAPDWVLSAALGQSEASVRAIRVDGDRTRPVDPGRAEATPRGAFVVGRYSGEPEGLPPGQNALWIGRVDGEGELRILSAVRARGQLAFGSAAPDAAGGLWLSGSFREELRFADQRIDSLGGLVGFLGRVDAEGRLTWIQTLGEGPGVRAAAQLGTTAAGDVILAGVFEDEVSVLDRELQASGDTDVLLVRFRGR